MSFPKAELGVQYNCSIECKDPEYVHIYSDKPTSLSFSVTRVKWVKVTGAGGEQYGTWTDDVISSAFNLPGVYATNDKIEIYERDDKKGYYRITDVYKNSLQASIQRTSLLQTAQQVLRHILMRLTLPKYG